MKEEIAYSLYCEKQKSLVMDEYGFQSFEKRQLFLPPRLSSVYMLHFVVKGEGTLTLEKDKYPLKKGALFFCPVDTKLTYHSSQDKPYTYYWINFHGDEAQPLLSQMGLSRENPVVYPDCFTELENALRGLVIENNGPSEHLAYATFYQIVHLVSQKRQPREFAKKSYCERIKEYISNNYADPNLRVAHIAETLHVSPNYMSRLFAAEMNISIVSYLVSYRMQKAQELLKNGFCVSEACEAVGYDDLCGFSKAYKKAFGYPPKQTKNEEMP